MFKKHKKLILVIGTLLMLGTTLQSLRSTSAISNSNLNSYEDLVEFFFEWREFHSPEMIDGRQTFIDIEGVTQPAPAPRFSRTPNATPGPPPTAGQHTDEVLMDWGFSQDEISDLRSKEAI